MSAIDPRPPQGTLEVPQPQDERLPVGMIVVVGVLSLGLFALGVVWATAIMHATQREVAEATGEPRAGTHLGQPEVGMVDQQMFSVERRAQQLRQDKQTRLEGSGWASRRENLVHIPIEQAMKEVAAGRRPSQTTPPPTGAPPEPQPPEAQPPGAVQP